MLVPVESIKRALVALERFANDSLAGRNSAYELQELLSERYRAAKPDEERLAMEAVMESVDPATWPGLTVDQRCALGRFAKPVASVLPPDPFDERSGTWLSLEDWERLKALPPGTKLYAVPPTKQDCNLVEALENAAKAFDEIQGGCATDRDICREAVAKIRAILDAKLMGGETETEIESVVERQDSDL